MAIVLIIPGAFESLRLVQHSMGNMEMCGHKHFCWKWGDRTTVMSTSSSNHVPNLTSICLMWDPALFHLSLARRMEFSKNRSSAIESMSSWTWMFFFSKINSRRLGAISNLRDRAFSNKLQFFTNILTFPAQFQTSLTSMRSSRSKIPSKTSLSFPDTLTQPSVTLGATLRAQNHPT